MSSNALPMRRGATSAHAFVVRARASSGRLSMVRVVILALVALAVGAGVASPGSAGAGGTAPTPRRSAQTTVRVSGTITDQTSGVLPGVTVVLRSGDGDQPSRETVTDAGGDFHFEVPVGEYLIAASLPSFATFEVAIRAEPRLEPLAITLELETVEQRVDVEVDPDNELRLNSLASLAAMSLSEDELLGLPTDEQDLVQHLMLLAGADSSGNVEDDISTFIIDGFDQGRLPSPDEIAQIIIDPSPLRVDGSGDGPRIEIITRPGTGTWRRSTSFNFADESLDARTPGEPTKPARQTRDLEVDLSGPVVSGLLDVDLEASTRSQERAVDSLRAITPSGDVSEGVVRPETERQLELDTDIALSPSHTLGIGFDYETQETRNSGVGGFTLTERGIDENQDQWAFQVRERRLGDSFANDFRVLLSQETRQEVPVSEGVAIDVADAFNRGGGTNRSLDEQTRFQIEDRLRWQRGSWSFEAGAEGWYEKQHTVFENNFNGTFDFASLHDYCQATGFVGTNCLPTLDLVSAAVAAGLPTTYQNGAGERVEITGLPTTFTQTSGNAVLDLDEVGMESFLQADRSFGDTASLRLGVRYEATTHSLNYWRLSPTVNGQYRLFEDTIVSFGARVSFRDFQDYGTLIRNDGGAHQRQLSISSPSFPDPFVGGTVSVDENRSSLYVLDPDYRAPVSFDPQVNVTQQLRGGLRLNVSYNLSYGYQQQRTRNINAPFPGTPLPDEILDLPRDIRQDTIDRMRPFYPTVGNIYQIETTGRSEGRRLRIRLQRRRPVDLLGIGLSGSLDYSYRWGEDDNDFTNPYLAAWGLSRLERRLTSQLRVRFPRDSGVGHPFWRALAWATYERTNLNFYIRAETGRPYSIRSGRDLNGDQSTRDRPPGVPRNSARGPGLLNVDMTVTKDFVTNLADGADTPPPGTRVRLQARVSNLLNTSQIRSFSGVLSSPLFDQPTGYRRGRTVRLSMHVDF